MKCNVCRDDVPELDKQSKAHILINKDAKSGHIVVHGDIDNKETVRELLTVASEVTEVPMTRDAKYLPAEIVFHNKQKIGDMLVFTCAIRDFKAAFPKVRVNVASIAGHIWDHNPNIDRTLKATDQNMIKIGPKRLTNASNRVDWHHCNSYRVSIEDALKVSIPQGMSRPDIYFTQEEYDAPRVIEGPYWIISTTGEKGWGCKMYPHRQWQLFVNQNPHITFVQIGISEENPPRLTGSNVIDYVGKTQDRETGIRDLFKLFLNAEGSIGLVSMHMHLSGALHKPAIVIAGAREPVHFTKYPGHAYLSTDGMLPCGINACWKCEINGCTNQVIRQSHEMKDEIVPKCVDMISPFDITKALRNYYDGGRLDLVKPSPKPLPKSKRGPINVVPTPPKPVNFDIQDAPIHEWPQLDLVKCGMGFGGGSLTDKDWGFIQGVINRFGIKTCLEFGAGLSTLLLNNALRNPGVQGWVKTYETNQGWINKIKAVNPFPDIILWDGVNFPTDEVPETYDMAFVDGPAGDQPRKISTQWAACCAPIVIVHDAGREWAKVYQEEYLKPMFDGPFKGGNRCHLWVKKGYKAVSREMSARTAPKPPETQKKDILAHTEACLEPHVEHRQRLEAESEKKTKRTQEAWVGLLDAPKSKKFIRIVSTARGWGGCARSVTTIMRKLLAEGHHVEFVPFRNEITSREWLRELAGALKNISLQLDYNTILTPCDVLLVYADDYIWEFERTELRDVFEQAGGDRRIMMLNYRRGKVGEIPWTRLWDEYWFLCSQQERELLKVHPGVKTKVLPPCTDLEPFFAVRPDYAKGLTIVRHSSQGDTKFAKDCEGEIMEAMKYGLIRMLPGPSFVAEYPNFKKEPRTDDPNVIANFLAKGNLFWYSLPLGYMDMGPRVILEAMAAGLPVLADNWGGAADRVIDGITGWLCGKKEQHLGVIKGVGPNQLRHMGEAGRQRAHDHFSPDAWIRAILGD